MAAVRGISHCYQRPTYEDWPYSVFTMAHGRSKEECDAILEAIALRHGNRRARDAVLLDRVQEDPAAVLHGGLQGLGVRSTPLSRRPRDERVAHRHALGRALPARARADAGRRQLAGAGDARDRARADLHRARRGRRTRRRRRQPLRRLRLLVGAADPRPRPSARAGRRSQQATAAGPASARRRPAEVALAAEVVRRIDERGDGAHDLLRHGGHDDRPAPGAAPTAAASWC